MSRKSRHCKVRTCSRATDLISFVPAGTFVSQDARDLARVPAGTTQTLPNAALAGVCPPMGMAVAPMGAVAMPTGMVTMPQGVTLPTMATVQPTMQTPEGVSLQGVLQALGPMGTMGAMPFTDMTPMGTMGAMPVTDMTQMGMMGAMPVTDMTQMGVPTGMAAPVTTMGTTQPMGFTPIPGVHFIDQPADQPPAVPVTQMPAPIQPLSLPQQLLTNPIAELAALSPLAALAATNPTAALAALSPALQLFNPALNPTAALLAFNPAAASTLALTNPLFSGGPFI